MLVIFADKKCYMSTSCLISISPMQQINIYFFSFQCQEFKKQADAIQEGLVETHEAPCDVVINSDIIFCCLSGPSASKDVSKSWIPDR